MAWLTIGKLAGEIAVAVAHVVAKALVAPSATSIATNSNRDKPVFTVAAASVRETDFAHVVRANKNFRLETGSVM
jgi:hypothetical protein